MRLLADLKAHEIENKAICSYKEVDAGSIGDRTLDCRVSARNPRFPRGNVPVGFQWENNTGILASSNKAWVTPPNAHSRIR